jgi:hypothetical protein
VSLTSVKCISSGFEHACIYCVCECVNCTVVKFTTCVVLLKKLLKLFLGSLEVIRSENKSCHSSILELNLPVNLWDSYTE